MCAVMNCVCMRVCVCVCVGYTADSPYSLLELVCLSGQYNEIRTASAYHSGEVGRHDGLLQAADLPTSLWQSVKVRYNDLVLPFCNM